MNTISGIVVSGIIAIAETENIELLDNSSTTNPVEYYLSQLPEPIPPRTPQTLPRKLPETPPNPLQPNPNQAPESTPLSPIPGTIIVNSFEFLDNTAFTTEELIQATQNLLGKPISFAQLLQVETIITKLYIEAGYINSGAYIVSGQSFASDSAVVQIQIVEGGLETVEITGTSQLRPNYIRDRLPSTKEVPLNQKKLLQDLQLLQLNPLIARISAQLAAGSRPEASTLEIDITEADTFSVEAFLDNGRSPSVGSFRRGARIQENNFLGFGDRLLLIYTNTDGSNAGDISYSFPLNRKNGSLNFAAGINDTKVVESPFEELDIKGDSYFLDFTLRQPIIFKPTQELALGITFSYQESQTELLGQDFPFTPNINTRGETTISAIRFFQDFVQRNPTDLFALRSQLSVGLDIFDSTVEDNAADSRFIAWSGQAQYVKLLAADTVLILRSDLQFANDSLLAQERFSLGGLNSVRGYRQNLLLTDNGIFASAEVKLPIARFASNQAILQFIPFIDFGTVWNVDSETDLEPDSLVSVGLGLELNFSDVFDARIDWGIPLVDADSEPGTLQENGVYFSIRTLAKIFCGMIGGY
ncbi:MAG: ShlB/FhaC/HecB family hemolysin secretion/activation protein [Xenococcaceae cyanobacterium MO_167.B27]|nr:ShlB/FhaC/HecB family hemolysin secretion/activation protein [Xenococcaceae cyanobacterium MO_167.B27]